MTDNYFPVNNAPSTSFALDEAGTTNQTCAFALADTGTGGGEAIKKAAVFVSVATCTAGQILIEILGKSGYDGPDEAVIGQRIVTAVGGYAIPLDKIPFTRSIRIRVTKSGGGGAATGTGTAYLCLNDGPAANAVTDWA